MWGEDYFIASLLHIRGMSNLSRLLKICAKTKYGARAPKSFGTFASRFAYVQRSISTVKKANILLYLKVDHTYLTISNWQKKTIFWWFLEIQYKHTLLVPTLYRAEKIRVYFKSQHTSLINTWIIKQKDEEAWRYNWR